MRWNIIVECVGEDGQRSSTFEGGDTAAEKPELLWNFRKDLDLQKDPLL